MFEEAQAELERFRRLDDTPGKSDWLMLAADLRTISGRNAEARGARAELRRLVARGYVDPGIPMRMYVNVGEKAFAERSTALTSIKVNPGFDPLRSDPRFQDLLRRMDPPQ